MALTKKEFRLQAQSLCGQDSIDAKDAINDFRKKTGVKNSTNWGKFKKFVNDNKQNLRKRYNDDEVKHTRENECFDNSWDNWCAEEFPEEWW